VAVAAVVGAGAGAVSVAVFVVVAFGTDFYFRAVSWREQKREKAST
jgi:hypothetical protein